MAARRKRARRGDTALSWLLTGLSGLGLTVGGFGAGVLIGIVTEEPSVLTGYWLGRSERVTLHTPPAAAGRVAPPADRDRAAKRTQGKEAPASRAKPATNPTRGLLPAVAAAPVGYAVQVGSFSSSEAARMMQTRLEGRGYESFVSLRRDDDGRRWRVRVGPFGARDRADHTASRLQRGEGLATWVVTLGERGD